ncbi:MAG: DUF6790 family protein [Burkholderiales bacterium]
MAALIQGVLSHLATILFVVAIAVAALRHDGRPFAARLLDWLLLLSVGGGGVWAGTFHIFAPQIAAASIGWQVSPFQFEVGVADLASGLVAIAAFWRSLPFKCAVVAYISLFFLGVTVGHVRDAMNAGNFAANNFGLLLLVTVLQMVGLPWLAWRTWRDERSRAGA